MSAGTENAQGRAVAKFVNDNAELKINYQYAYTKL